MKRGDIWTVAGGSDYAGKPRPAVVVQDDAFAESDSVTICSFTTRRTETDFFRPVVLPTMENGLQQPCRLMVDKLTTVPKTKLGKKIGDLDDDSVVRLNKAVVLFLGLAAASRSADGGLSPTDTDS